MNKAEWKSENIKSRLKMNTVAQKTFWQSSRFAQECELLFWKFLRAIDSEASGGRGQFAVGIAGKIESEEIVIEKVLLEGDGVFLVRSSAELSRTRHCDVVTGQRLADDDSFAVEFELEDWGNFFVVGSWSYVAAIVEGEKLSGFGVKLNCLRIFDSSSWRESNDDWEKRKHFCLFLFELFVWMRKVESSAVI